MTGIASARQVAPVVRAEVAALAGLPAGPVLGAALARVDVGVVSGYELVLVLRARARQSCHEQGMFLAAVAQTLRRTDAGYGRLAEHEVSEPRRWNIGELRAALVLSRGSALSLGELADALDQRLPAVLAAMVAGELDLARARVFHRWTGQLSVRHAREVVRHLLPRAPRMTCGELVEAIQRAAIELDPRWARRRYERSLRHRQVTGTLRPDGTAELTGRNLPADQVAAACDRIDALAHRLKQAGYPSLLRWIRADLYLGKLDGRYEGLTDEQLFAHLMANPVPQPAPDPEPPTPDDERTLEEYEEYCDYLIRNGLLDESVFTDPDPTDDEPDDANPDDGDGPDGDDGGPGDGALGRGEGRQIAPDDPSTPDTGDHDHPQDQRADDEPRPGQTSTLDTADDETNAVSKPRGRGMRLLVGLSTLAGLDRRPGQLLGFGYLHAELARRVSAAPTAAWYYALVHPDGTPIQTGPIRQRPTRPWAEGHIPHYHHLEAWLTLTPDELTHLTHHPPPGWNQLLTAITTHLANHPPGPPNPDPTTRYPNTRLRRWLHLRDRRCIFPGCRTAAHHTDADHTIEYARGGPTTATNLGSLCQPDHLMRHEHGWQAHQTAPGHYTWTSPLGHQYHRTPPPGPGDTLPPMTRPTRHCEDPIPTPINDGFTYHGTETCKHIIPPRKPPPPPPAPPGDPPF